MNHSTADKHWVIITDETGIASVFPKLKEKLSQEHSTSITIVYHSKINFTFQRELAILTSHFPTRLYVLYETAPNGVCKPDSIEPVINANIATVITFTVSGGPDFTMSAKYILTFLGINEIDIQEQFFSTP